MFVCFYNEGLSAKKTIAELWDGRLRGGIGLLCAVGGSCQDFLLGQPLKAGSALEADHEAPMPGHLTRGGGTRQVYDFISVFLKRGVPIRAPPPHPLPRRH